MKIFNIENGVEKVYVQISDIILLNSNSEEIPTSIFHEFVKKISIINDEKNIKFIEFNQPHEIDFFKRTDWIVDYKDIKKLSEEEILKEIDKIVNEMTDIVKLPQKEKTLNLLKKYNLLKYKMSSMINIIQIKQGSKKLDFPLVPDYDSPVFSSNYGLYEVKNSFDPNKLLLYRTDGLCLSDLDLIPQSLIYEAVTGSGIEKSKTGILIKNLDISRKFSEDRKYLIIEFQNKKVKQETGIKKIIKTIFNNQKKY